jgi:hypothetical protein
MIWLNPWAWVGMAGVAVPVLIHLLGRGHARVHRFPSLRFLEPSRLLPTRRTRIQDPLLLALRCTVILFAVAALAQPVLISAHRRQGLDRGLARAIVVDTSASMHRALGTGMIALDSARSAARRLATDAQASIVVESNEPRRALAGAVNWLTRQGRRGELVVLSDFQRGQIDSIDIATIPASVGVSLHRLAVVDSAIAAIQSSKGFARATWVGNRMDAEWDVREPRVDASQMLLLGSLGDSAALSATRIAASTVAQPVPFDSSRRVAIVFPRYAGRAALQASAQPSYSPWMVHLLIQLRAEGVDAMQTGVARVDNADRLVLFTNLVPGSLPATRLAAIVSHAMSVAPPARELDPESLPQSTIAGWQRPVPTAAPTGARPLEDSAPFDGRWLWFAALVLLMVEIPLRRNRLVSRSATVEESARAA